MVQISDSDIGKRVTIRLRDGSGFRDLVGHLVSKDSIRDRRDEVITFDPSEIHIWREIVDVERTASSGAPLSIRIYELEKLTSSTWQAAEEVFVGGWLMRADVGVTKRANSALVLNTEDHIDELIAWYGERNLNPIVSLIPDLHHELDKKLEARGFTHLLDMNVMVKDCQELIKNCEFPLSDFPSDEWLAIHKDHKIKVLLNRCPAKYLEVRDGGRLIGIGRVAFADDWAVLSRIWVSQDQRGRGYGKRILEALESVAGARKIALQVSTSNELAVNLYELAGYKIHHTVRFRELSQQRDLFQGSQH